MSLSKYLRTLVAASVAMVATIPAACAQTAPDPEGSETAIAVDAAALEPGTEELTENSVAGAEDTAEESAATPTEGTTANMVSEPVVQQTPPSKSAEKKKASDSFVIKRILPIEGPIKYGEWHWNDEGVPAGPLVITVDLDARVLSVFRDGYEIGTSAVLLGTDKHPTPLGTFPILTKERHNVSEKYDNAPMPWTLRLTWDGIAIHGGSEIQNGYASHGCIAVPDPLAAKLFDAAKRGDKVVITRGKMIGMGDSII